MIKTYNPPERQFIHNAIFVVLLSAILVFIVSFFYGLIIAVSPLVYINFFVTVAFGTAIGFGVRIFAKIFKVTSKRIAIGIAVISGVFGVYFSWVAYLLYFFSESPLTEAYFLRPLLLFQPNEVFAILNEVNNHGLWEFMRVPFTGWGLTTVWLIEAAIIIVGPVLLTLNQPIAPFSTKQNAWYKKFVLDKDFKSISFRKEFLSALEEQSISAIDALDRGRATHFSRISVFFLPEENEQYLTVENISSDRAGKKENLDTIIHLMRITNNDAMALIEKYHGKKAFVFDY